jgi:hypothetical protein
MNFRNGFVNRDLRRIGLTDAENNKKDLTRCFLSTAENNLSSLQKEQRGKDQ